MDQNILDIDSNTLRQLENILENKNTRDSFLKAVPAEYFDYVDLQLMDNASYRYHMTTARWLLLQLGKKGARVSDIIIWLEKQDIQRALVLLKKDVPLQITEQPPPLVRVQKGSRLSIFCKASSYPPPEYQWFKDDQELLLQEDSELLIHPIKEEDGGMYICRVVKLNLETKDYSYLYSNPVEIILEGSCMGSSESSSSAIFDSNSNPTSTREISSLDSSQYIEQIMPRTYNVPVTITIRKHPYVRGKIPQGMNVCLHCQAESSHPVSYQWYKNGKILNGATSPKLELNDLVPDLDTGDMKWEYFCKAFYGSHEVFSRTAIVELATADDTTPYYPSEKYAFMIANEKYDNLEDLKKPAYDVSDLAILLESMKFKVFPYINLTYVEMNNAFKRFCAGLKPKSYIMFYFAGHGFQQYGQMYLQPVDSSEDYRPHESISTDYILQCLQKSNPAMNILLIDACRKLPPQVELNVLSPPPPITITEAKMKNNTIYGYSTPFHYFSHESNSERNSFFVKYLKKYIRYNKTIQEVLLHVQRDFEADVLVKGVQFPVIETSLAGCRKLCDEIEADPNSLNRKAMWLEDIKSDFVNKSFEIPNINCSITLEMDVFINGIVANVSLDIRDQLSLLFLSDLEINLVFDMDEIEVQPNNGVCLRDLKLKVGPDRLVLKKYILGIQKIKDKKLTGKLCLSFTQLQARHIEDISINIEKIANMKFYADCSNITVTEEMEIVSSENNVSS